LAGGTIYIEHLDDRWLAIDILPGEAISQGMYFSCIIQRLDTD
jgi:DnaJ family protein A protein 2